MMKMYLVFIACFLFALSGLKTTAILQKTSFTTQLHNAFKEGNAQQMKTLLGSDIQINLANQKFQYSKADAIQFLQDFFTENPPKSFEFVHTGKIENEMSYIIANYTSTKRSYTLYLLVRNAEKQNAALETIEISIDK